MTLGSSKYFTGSFEVTAAELRNVRNEQKVLQADEIFIRKRFLSIFEFKNLIFQSYVCFSKVNLNITNVSYRISQRS